MMCYQDMTFCPFFKNCKNGDNCMRALTEQVKQDAQKWWGDGNPPISIFVEKPKCFKGDNE